jgi:hypothetical protein
MIGYEHYINSLESDFFAPTHTNVFKRAEHEKYTELPPVENNNIFARHLGTGVWV